MEKNRLIWGSRRGMLELDLFLLPFVEKAYPELNQADQQRYEDLLTEQDQDLFAWLMGKEKPDNKDLQRIVDLIREHTRKTS